MQARRADKPIIVLKTGDPVPAVAETRGDFAKMIERAIGEAWGGGYAVVDLRAGAPPDPADAAGFIITGSAANVPAREPWMLRAEAWLREVVGTGRPTLGICFGHQILAQAFGGEVAKNPLGREIGTVRVERLADDALFDGMPAAFEANATHVDTVLRLPAGAVALARSSLDAHQALRFSTTCYGVQFHPEIDAEVMRAYLAARAELLRAEGLDAEVLATAVTEADLARRTLRNFVHHVMRAPRRA